MAFAYDLFDRGALLRIGLPIAVSRNEILNEIDVLGSLLILVRFYNL